MKKDSATGKGFALALMLAAAVPVAQASSGDSNADAGKRPSQAVEDRLGPHVTPRVQSEVMVFGTWHLAAFRDWMEPRHIEDTLALLERYAPTRIAIERIPPDEIALLAERAPHDAVAKQTLDRYGRASVPAGHAMQQALGLDRTEAERRAGELLERVGPEAGVAERVELAGHLLAAYEFDSAVLQWSYLTPAERASVDVFADDVRDALDERLQNADESITLVMPLARRLGLQRLYHADSQYDVLRTLAFRSEVVDEVFGHATKEVRAEEAFRRHLARSDATRDGDEGLLDLLLDVNTYAVQVDDNLQWVPWLTMDHLSGLDGTRYAMLELRNHRMAELVLEAAASTRPERVLFIVGFSHKSHVDRLLEPHLGVRLVQPTAYVD